MRVLALEPYYGGSHRAFLDGWVQRSCHQWTLFTLPAHQWKWRMRHAALTFVRQFDERVIGGDRWDVMFASDMLDLAAFRGLAVQTQFLPPCVVYFHENQLTYPVRFEEERDAHFTFTNLTTALAATEVWFNSNYHLREFYDTLPAWLARVPDRQPLESTREACAKSTVQYPGVETFSDRTFRRDGPLRIVWAARWEHDKNPELFFEAVEILQGFDIDFRLYVVGEQFRNSPAIFKTARQQFEDHIDHWGYQATRERFEGVLGGADVYVSTALHEFFGIGAVEAIRAGCFPLLPRRLAYPELLELKDDTDMSPYFYDGSARMLAERLRDLANELACGGSCYKSGEVARTSCRRFDWDRRAQELDVALESVACT